MTGAATSRAKAATVLRQLLLLRFELETDHKAMFLAPQSVAQSHGGREIPLGQVSGARPSVRRPPPGRLAALPDAQFGGPT